MSNLRVSGEESGTIGSMTLIRRTLPERTVRITAALCGLVVFATLGAAQAPGGSSATGATTPGHAKQVEGALQQLSAPTGQSLAAPTQDSFKGSVVSGRSTGTVMDLSLDDAIARGLRQNLGLILQTSSQQNAKGQQLEQLQSLLPTVTGNA